MLNLQFTPEGKSEIDRDSNPALTTIMGHKFRGKNYRNSDKDKKKPLKRTQIRLRLQDENFNPISMILKGMNHSKSNTESTNLLAWPITEFSNCGFGS